MSTIKLEASEYPAGVAKYVALVPPGDLLAVLDVQATELRRLVGDLSDEDALAVHRPYAWSIKQVVGHLTDCERVFGYRAMRLARNDATELPAFDENAYVQHADFDRRPLGELLAGFEMLRNSHLLMFRGFAPDAWLRTAVVNGHPMSARAVAYVMAGHTQHHLEILRQRMKQ